MKIIRLSILFLLGTVLMVSCRNEQVCYLIGVSQCSDDEWRQQMNNEILREALFYDGVQVEIRKVPDDSKKQEEDIRYFINRKVDLLIVSPNEAAAMTPVVEEAYDRGIPVIVVDRKILSDKYTAYIGADNYEIGKAVGNYVASRLNGKGRVVEISGLKSSTPAIERNQGFMNAIRAYPEIQVLCSEDAGWLRKRADEKMDTILAAFPEIDLVFAQNDRMAAGAYEAARRVGRAQQMKFVGIDALPGKEYGLEMVLDSILTATFIYPTGGDKVMQTAMNILRKCPFDRETILTTAVVDPTNARIMDLQTNQITELDSKIGTLNGRIDLYLSQYANQQLVLYGSLLFLLLVGGLLLVVYKSLRSKNRLNRELSIQKEQVESQRDELSSQRDELSAQRDQLENQRDQLILLSRQLEEATHAKLVFFTNISHDFRTPLTLVADPVDQLLADKNLNADQNRLLHLVKKNVNILLRLVNQILDFRKYENGKMEFVPVALNIRQCFEGWNESFQAVARKKHIHFSFEAVPGEDYRTRADVEKLERIYFNLLSNAFKFTPENGDVQVRLMLAQVDECNFLCFTVRNTGSVISAEHIRHIFDRFYKIDLNHAGSGIGLALVKAFVEMHEGTITVESDEKLGTQFTVQWPVCSSETVQDIETTVVVLPEEMEELTPDEPEEDKNDASKQSVLIIDDNADIRTYVRSLLAADYSVIEASDGMEGIRRAMKYVPDLIISDVMMPGIDGMECCRRLKSEMQTCHIPVILLTACSLDEQRIQGYDGGADSYISKPFSAPLLIARVRNLIDSHRRLKQFFGDRQTLAKEDICDMDKDFIERFKALIEAKLNDSELNVEELGREMGFSRVQLYRKIKSLTNYAPNELLRIARLKRAASLLASSELTVAEIAYEVGFTSPSYFAKCYKEQFGEAPTDFLKRKSSSGN